MKHHSTLLAVSTLAILLGASTARAADDSLSGFPHKTVPVLVKVDSQGKITRISPAMELRPEYRRLIRRSIQEMVIGPATYHGRAIPSQLVMFLVPEATSRQDGRYDVRFTSVKNQPVPAGNWYWLHENGHRLALVNESDRQGRRLRNSRIEHGTHLWPIPSDQTPTQSAPASMRNPPPSSANRPPDNAGFSRPGER